MSLAIPHAASFIVLSQPWFQCVWLLASMVYTRTLVSCTATNVVTRIETHAVST